MKIKEALEFAKIKLQKNNIEDSSLIARQLLAFKLNKDKQYLIINCDKEVDEALYKSYCESLNELIKGMPIQYITNNQEFMGFNFYVDENVLIPQPDTEILVENVLKICKNIKKQDSTKDNKDDKSNAIKILDLCTGSGAIAISLAKILSQDNIIAIVTASDVSKKALQVAQKNNKLNDTNVQFVKSDLFAEFQDKLNVDKYEISSNCNNSEENKFDIIVSNPPYIKSQTIKELSNQVQNEPILALDGGGDGLNFYRAIISEAYKYIKNNGYLCLEIGFDQKSDVLSIISKYSEYREYKVIRDLSDNDRCVICQIKK